VNDADYHPPFRFTGRIDNLTYKIGPAQFASDDHQVIVLALAKAQD
jgi:hypothetical protein